MSARGSTRRAYRSESEIQAGILGYLGVRGDVFFWRQNTMAYSPRPGQFIRSGDAGTADILGVWRGRFIAFEVKREGKDATALQAAWGAKVTAHGGLYAVVRSVDDVRAAMSDTPAS